MSLSQATQWYIQVLLASTPSFPGKLSKGIVIVVKAVVLTIVLTEDKGRDTWIWMRLRISRDGEARRVREGVTAGEKTNAQALISAR